MCCRTMDFVNNNNKKRLNVSEVGLQTDTLLMIIRIPHSWILKFIARALLLAIVIVSLPRLGSIFGQLKFNFPFPNSNAQFNSINTEFLPLLFRDLANEGLLKTGDRALFVNNEEEAIFNSRIFSNINIDLVSYSDLQRQVLMPDETFEFVMLRDFHATTAEFFDRVLNSGGVAVVQLSDDPSEAFLKPSGYRIVYLRRFYSTFVGMRKTSSNKATNGRRLLSVRAPSPGMLKC